MPLRAKRTDDRSQIVKAFVVDAGVISLPLALLLLLATRLLFQKASLALLVAILAATGVATLRLTYVDSNDEISDSGDMTTKRERPSRVFAARLGSAGGGGGRA